MTWPGAFDLSQPTISHHLKVLHDSGLLDREKRGVWVYYRARTAGPGQPGDPDRLPRSLSDHTTPRANSVAEVHV